MAQETDVHKLRKQVIQNLDDALESLSEAHLICHEKLYPTWQTVDQDIQMLLRSVQALAIDLKRRNSDTAVLKDPQVEPVEPALKPPVPKSPAEKKKKAKLDEPVPEPPSKKKVKPAKSSPARRKKEKIRTAETTPQVAETQKADPLEEESQGCPWCDSQRCEEVDSQKTEDGGTDEKVLVCLECGQTYSASTIENT